MENNDSSFFKPFFLGVLCTFGALGAYKAYNKWAGSSNNQLHNFQNPNSIDLDQHKNNIESATNKKDDNCLNFKFISIKNRLASWKEPSFTQYISQQGSDNYNIIDEPGTYPFDLYINFTTGEVNYRTYQVHDYDAPNTLLYYDCKIDISGKDSSFNSSTLKL